MPHKMSFIVVKRGARVQFVMPDPQLQPANNLAAFTRVHIVMPEKRKKNRADKGKGKMTDVRDIDGGMEELGNEHEAVARETSSWRAEAAAAADGVLVEDIPLEGLVSPDRKVTVKPLPREEWERMRDEQHAEAAGVGVEGGEETAYQASGERSAIEYKPDTVEDPSLVPKSVRTKSTVKLADVDVRTTPTQRSPNKGLGFSHEQWYNANS